MKAIVKKVLEHRLQELIWRTQWKELLEAEAAVLRGGHPAPIMKYMGYTDGKEMLDRYRAELAQIQEVLAEDMTSRRAESTPVDSAGQQE